MWSPATSTDTAATPLLKGLLLSPLTPHTPVHTEQRMDPHRGTRRQSRLRAVSAAGARHQCSCPLLLLAQVRPCRFLCLKQWHSQHQHQQQLQHQQRLHQCPQQRQQLHQQHQQHHQQQRQQHQQQRQQQRLRLSTRWSWPRRLRACAQVHVQQQQPLLQRPQRACTSCSRRGHPHPTSPMACSCSRRVHPHMMQPLMACSHCSRKRLPCTAQTLGQRACPLALEVRLHHLSRRVVAREGPPHSAQGSQQGRGVVEMMGIC